MLITAIFHVQPEGYQEPDNEDGLKYQPDYPVNGIQTENLSILCVTCFPTVPTSPYEK